MQTIPLRLLPEQDLRAVLETVLAAHNLDAAFVNQGIGSLSAAQLRLAGSNETISLEGDLEILTLAGSLSPDGAHLHMSVAVAQGKVTGGHVQQGCIVRTTVEILLTLLPDHRFSREPDILSGYKELVIRKKK